MIEHPIPEEREERRTFRLHLAHSVLESLAAGVLSNAGLMAVKELHAADWQLTLPLGISSLGMFASWLVSQRMARRNKRPYILFPFALQACCAAGMAFVPGSVWFLLLAGCSGIFETMVRPAMAAFFRQNYRADRRGRASGLIRGWCALAFLVSNLGSAWGMQHMGGGRTAIMIQMVVATVWLAICWVCIAAVRIREDEGKAEVEGWSDAEGGLSGIRILKEDRRFRTYLTGTFLFLIGGLVYVSLIPAVLSKDFGYGYLECALLLHVLPSLVSFFSTPFIGRRLDHANPLKLWGLLRFGWGLDPLLLAGTAMFAPGGTIGIVLASFARCSRGAVMGGTWVLWWLVGVNYFAPPGANTSRYMGIQVFLNGFSRLIAAGASAWLLSGIDRLNVLVVGGSSVMLSALHVWWQSQNDPGGTGSLPAQEAKLREKTYLPTRN